jgi:integrase
MVHLLVSRDNGKTDTNNLVDKIMSLSALDVRNAKPKDKPYKLSDEKGMHLEVRPNGSRYWRLQYRHLGKQKVLALGVYPEVSLAQARASRDEARKLIAQGIDPSEARQEAKAAKLIASASSFEAVAREWHQNCAASWAPLTGKRILERLAADVFPAIGKKPIAEITAPMILACLRKIEARGVNYTAHKARQYIGQVFRYAIATGSRAERDPAADLRGALAPVQEVHRASITEPKKVAELLRALDGYTGNFPTKCALKLAPLIFVRPGELRHAEWAEFDIDAQEWRIPGEKMKMGALHVVPLSAQALAIVAELRPLTGSGKYLFPSLRAGSRPMSENTVNAALRRLGYGSDDMTGHGFRSMASTLLNEQGWHRDAIERQLAHAERDPIRGAYNYAEHLPERRRMMQAWADYLDALKAGAQVIPLRAGAKP